VLPASTGSVTGAEAMFTVPYLCSNLGIIVGLDNTTENGGPLEAVGAQLGCSNGVETVFGFATTNGETNVSPSFSHDFTGTIQPGDVVFGRVSYLVKRVCTSGPPVVCEEAVGVYVFTLTDVTAGWSQSTQDIATYANCSAD
jgi:hypothetical protein